MVSKGVIDLMFPGAPKADAGWTGHQRDTWERASTMVRHIAHEMDALLPDCREKLHVLNQLQGVLHYVRRSITD